jgi:hypothetical protein
MQLEPELEATFDRLYDTVHERRPVTAELIAGFNEVHTKLLPRIHEARRAVAVDARRRNPQRTERLAGDPDDVPTW